MDHTPVLASAGPLFRNVHHRQIQHFQQAVIRGEHGFGFGHLPKLTVEALYGVGGINQSPHLLRVLKVGAQVGPVLPPGLRYFRVFLIPALRKGVQGSQRRGLIHGRIDCLQIGHQGFQVLVGDVLAGMTELMDDAVLDFRLGKYRFNCRRESSQIVRTGDENILHATVFEPIEYSSPEFGALVFADSHAQNIFLSVQINADGNVNSFLHDLAFAANRIVDRVQKHHRVDGLQWSLLPFFRDGQDLVCDPADGGIRDLHAVDVTNMGLYVSGSHAPMRQNVAMRTWTKSFPRCPD